ncbi:MAG: tetratricopeptide repeat protein [Elusimicrobia bacterium]|nr:tetratricopeptide repeat protein [Elusimicrobiota bacterium]
MPNDALTSLSKAEFFLARNRHADALPLIRAAEKRSRDRFLKAEIAWRLGETLRALGRFEEALKAYRSARRFYRLCRVPSESLRAALGASACLRILGRYPEARGIWAANDRSGGFRPPDDPSREDVLLETALVERGLGNHAAAGRILRKCIPSLTKRNDIEALQHAWWALGGVERFSGNYVRALRAFREAERMAGRLKDPHSRAYALCGQAGTLRVLGKGRESFRKYQQAYSIFKRVEDLFGQAYGLCGMGNAERVWGNASKTIPLYERSAKLYARVGDEGSMAFAFWGLGGSYRRMGEIHKSRACYRRAYGLFQKVKDERGLIMCLLGSARTETLFGNQAAARRALRQAALHARRSGLPYEKSLCRLEWERLGNADNSSFNQFLSFGIPPSVVRLWKDIP